ncbi:hypothetical protein [Kribbella catacumbae]|uniref:hypothetical protein n=1 Tax=Kribbella catacumbae TaxID=460086 RepID=UPI000379C603|nr:hypothetical protein [Kribbella catacumbae]
MSDQSNQSDYDRRVKDILDRVANGHLTTEEAATLIAAIPSTTPTTSAGTTSPAGAASAADASDASAGPEAQSSGSTGEQSPSAGSDAPSPSVWADVVDSPDAASTAATPASPSAPSAPKHAAEPSASGEGSVVDDAAVVAAPSPAEPVVAEETLHSDLVVPSGVRRVTIRAIGRRVRLIGEPAVTGVAVDGPHVIKRDGDTLAINSEGDMGVSIDGLSMLRNPTDLKSHVNGFAKELSIRVNPLLQVEIEVTGGSVIAERLPGLSRVRVTAGTAKVTDVDGPIDLLVQAGTATLDAQITKGRSRVRVESGSASVTLRRGSDVRVHTESQLGRVTWAGAVSGQSKDVEIGRGRAALDVEVLVGTAQITSD